VINLADAGAVGNGTTDNFALIQAQLDGAPQHSQFYLPAGNYLTSATLDFKTKAHRIVGDGQGFAGSVYLGGSRLFGSFAGPILECQDNTEGSSFSDLGIVNIQASGVGLQVSGANVAIDRLAVSAYRGIVVKEQTFTVGIRNVIVHCNQANWPAGSVGIQLSNHGAIDVGDVVSFEHGIRVAGVGNGIRHCRIEVNKVGILLGMNLAGNNWGVNACSVDSVSMEANDVGIQCRVSNVSSLRSVLIQGSVNSPSGQSVTGLLIENAKDFSVDSLGVAGSHSTAAIRITSGQAASRSAFRNVTANNSHASGKTWDLPAGIVQWGRHN